MLTPGNHDGQLAWDTDSVALLRDRLGVTDVALTCDLALETGNGIQLVRVMHGHQFDQYNAFTDPRSPVDTPLGHHVVREVLPKLAPRDHPGSLLEGVRWCNGDPSAFLGSRLLYRMVAGWLWWLAVPFAAALVLRLLSFAPGVKPLLDHHAERWLILFGILVVAIAVVAGVTGIATMLRVNRALADASVSDRGDAAAHNAAVRDEAARLVAAGYAGLITGHTHEPEISQVGDGFYANTGCATEVVRARKARLGLPAPFLAVRRLSMIELQASGSGPVLSVSLSLAERPVGQPSLLERLVLAPERARPQALQIVGQLPDGATWPVNERAMMPWVRRRRVRRVAAFGLLAAGLLNVVFAFLWPVRWLRPVDVALPFSIHHVSGLVAVIGGLALAGVARGVRHGYRRAWLAALVILLISVVYRLAQGAAWEGTGIASLAGLWLLVEHRHFRVSPRVSAGSSAGPSWPAWWRSAWPPCLTSPSSAPARPATSSWSPSWVRCCSSWRRRGPAASAGEPENSERRAFERARAIVDRYGGDTLDYFALRDDKSWLFSGNTLVAYSVINRVMLVSPDPIGPVNERLDAWSDAMDLADTNGWYSRVLGASSAWLPIYRAAGLNDLYMGDEAIVDCQTFSLKGKSMKSLRGAYNRTSQGRLPRRRHARAGGQRGAADATGGSRDRDAPGRRRARLLDDPEPDVRPSATPVCCWPSASDADGKPVAFNQYIPASHINGYSLDLMRRTERPGRAERPDRLRDHRDDQLDGRAGTDAASASTSR